ncbi:unnamed protein product, partial [Chrysoparadoxa australica]
MKKLVSTLILAGVMTQANALSPKLNKTMDLFKACMAEVKVPLCDANFEEMVSELKKVGLDPRGEFVYVLKDVLKKEGSKEVVLNLNEKLKVLAPVYIELDGTSNWSGRDILVLQGQVSVEVIKYAPVNAKELEELFVQQKTPAARYNFLGALHNKAKGINEQNEVEELITFGQFAKNHIKAHGDEFYIYETAVDLIKKLTIKNLEFIVGFEGVYEIELLDAAASKTLKVDNVVVSLADSTNGLLVNFVSSQYRATKFAFKGAGLLGNTAFSNQKVYVNSNELASPGFKFDIDFATNTVKGSFYSKRFGDVKFLGKQKSNNTELYQDVAVDSLSLGDVVGTFPVKVGAYSMTLKVEKNELGETEAALLNDNALIVFSKVTFNSKFNVLKAIDWQLERV